MALEDLTGVSKFISALNPAWPVDDDFLDEGDNHVRGIKNVVKNTFPNLNAAVTATAAQLNASSRLTGLVLMPAQPASPLAEVSFIGIPPGVVEVVVHLVGVSTNAALNLLVRIGTAAGFEVASYQGGAVTADVAGVDATGFLLTGFQNAAMASTGAVVLRLMDVASNTWVCNGGLVRAADGAMSNSAGVKVLAGMLDRVQLLTGASTFDAGSVSVSYRAS